MIFSAQIVLKIHQKALAVEALPRIPLGELTKTLPQISPCRQMSPTYIAPFVHLKHVLRISDTN
jgi:hypothetical protein